MSSLGIFDKETKTYKKVADLSKPAVIDSAMSDSSTNAVQNKVVKSYVDDHTVVDSGMSDTSTNAVQNKAVKSYVDTRTTLDTAMSDNSTKAVQNKVVKSYVDTRTTFDSAMSDTSTNAVQNKVVKSYVDGRTTFDSAMSDTSTNAVQNKVVKSYVDGKFKQKSIAYMSGDGKTSYCQLCTIKISNNYVNMPIEITVQERGRATLDRLTVLFDSVYNNDPNLLSFKVFGEFGDWYISKRAASTWVIYGQKNEPWGHLIVVDYVKYDGVNVTWDVTGVTALPDSKTKAIWGGNVNHAVSADSANSVAWNNITGKPSTYTPSSHTHTKSQITDFPSSLPANGGNSATVNGHTVNSDVPSGAKFTDTDTWRPLGTTADTACAGNDSRLSNARPASDVYAWAKASSKPSYSWSEITSKPSTFTPASHTHNYAGSSSAGGSANSAVKLDTSTAGSATQPVYFSGGKPVACSYTLDKSVPSNAVFTDTDTKVTNTLNKNAKAYVTGTTSASTNTGTQIFDTGVYLGTGTGQLTLEGSSSINYTSGSSVLNVKMPEESSSICGVNIVPYNKDYSNYLTGLNVNCGTSTNPGMRGINVYCSANNYQSTVYINRSGTNSYALQVPNGKSYIATIYSNSSTITTSDREKKTDIQSISDKYEELFFKLQPRLFKFKDGTSGRIHIGAIAQEVEEALKEVGIPDTDFAGFVRQEKEYVVNEETGEITQEEGYDYYLRYEEFVMLLCHMLQKLYAEKEEQDNKIADLESRIVALESKLG